MGVFLPVKTVCALVNRGYPPENDQRLTLKGEGKEETMKDLKHLIYFERLLEEANNELVKQAKAEGKLALGYTCYFVPEPEVSTSAHTTCQARYAHTRAAYLSAALRAASIISTRCCPPRPAR